MALSPGTRLGVYEVTALIGEGGMGQVYRATDTKLKRQVAIKILPPSVAADAERLARFQREAEVLASLNHPNIAHIHGLEESAGVRALVMELVEGEDLSRKIEGLRAKGAGLPLDEALPIAKQIAEALDAAHEQGIVHRDLKPANIMVRSDGTVKVLDFGLAKAMEPASALRASAGQVLSQSPTITTPAMMTGAGMILGTAAYMSPEQARGRTVDKRADIWAFGTVFYELLTGARLFEGETVSDTLAAVLKTEPAWDRVPASIRPLLRRCLERDPARRLRDIGDARLWLESGLADAPSEIRPRRRWLIPVAAAMGLALVAGAGGYWLRPRAPQASVLELSVVGPDEASFSAWAELSPDGRFLAFAAPDSGRPALWLRPTNSLESRVLVREPASQVSYAFWSQDSRWLAYFSGGRLKKVDTWSATPSPLVVCECAPNPRGGTWRRDVIAFAPGTNGGIVRVSASGGTPTPVTTIDVRLDSSHRFPSFLPDGRHFLYIVSSSDPRRAGIHVGDIESGQTTGTRLLDADSHGSFVPSAPGSTRGHILFVKDESLRAVAFDARRIELLGEPTVLARNVFAINARGGFSSSDGGLLAYYAGGLFSTATLTWYARNGASQGPVVPGEKGSFSGIGGGLRLSPDGRVVASAYGRTAGAANRLTLFDITRGAVTPLFDQSTFAAMPVWTSDSKTMIFSYSVAGVPGLFRYSPQQGGAPELLMASDSALLPTDWSSDGRLVVFHSGLSTQSGHLSVLTLPEKKAYPWLRGPATEYQGQLAPGASGPWWMAYVSTESGQPEVYLESFTLEGRRAGRVLVSLDGGDQPRWRADGRELYYLSRERLMAVDVRNNFTVGVPRELFKVPTILPGSIYQPYRYDVSADGQRFVFATVTAGPKPAPLSIVVNWQQTLAP